jgi:O-methyltransferase domain
VAPLPPPQVIDFGLRLRRLLLRAADALLPPQAAMWQHTMAGARAEVIGVVAELRVADLLASGPATAEDLAGRLDVNADVLHRVLRAAADDGLFRLDRRGRFKLTRLGGALRADAEPSLRPWARYLALDSTRAAWADLGESVRTGKAAFPRVHGTSVWSWFAEHPEEEQLFAAAMRQLTELEAPALAGLPMLSGSATHCDVAGGAGTLLGAMLVANPALKGVLVESPGVLAEAETHLTGLGVRDRAELVTGDIFGEIDATADTYSLKNILHDWDDERSLQILRAVRATMAPGSRLIVIEQKQERNEPSHFASITDLQMLTQCDDGRERSEAELKTLLTEAGLTPGRAGRGGLHQVVEGVAA